MKKVYLVNQQPLLKMMYLIFLPFYFIFSVANASEQLIQNLSSSSSSINYKDIQVQIKDYIDAHYHHAFKMESSLERGRVVLRFFGKVNDSEGETSIGYFSFHAKHEDKGQESIIIIDVIDTYLKPSFYGQKLLGSVLPLLVNFIQEYSTVKDSRITLEAWSGHQSSGAAFGAYIWGKYGFDYQDQYFLERGLDGDYYFVRDSIHQKFKVWLNKYYKNNLGEKRLTRLLKLVDSWKHPWQIAELKIPDFDNSQDKSKYKEFVEAKLGLLASRNELSEEWFFNIMNYHGINKEMGLVAYGRFPDRPGKQFLTDGQEKVRWYGVLFPNRYDSPGMKRYNQEMKL